MAVTFPTFEDLEILMAEKLNAFVQSLEDKFTSGFGSTDIDWPLVAEDNLVMGTGASGYEIVGGTKILKLVNAAAYDTLADAITAVGTSGCVFIPPNTTIPTDGVSLPSTIGIIGAGPSSVIKANAGAAHVLNADGGGSCLVANLTINGNHSTATAAGLLMDARTSSIVHNVRFRDCGLAGLSLTSSCLRIVVSGCHFDGGAEDHLFGSGVDGLTISGCTFNNSAKAGINLTASGGASLLRNVTITGNSFRACTEESINVVGSGGYSVNRETINISDNVIDGALSSGFASIRCGSADGQMQDVVIADNQISNAAQDGIFVWAQNAQVSGNNAQNVGQHGVNCASSAYSAVTGNNLQNATNVGIVGTNGGTDMVFLGNNVLNCATAMYPSAGCYHVGNVGNPRDFFNGTAPCTVTIPANHLRAGDSLDITALATVTGGSADTFLLQIDGKTIASIPCDGIYTGDLRLNARLVLTGTTTAQALSFGLTESLTSLATGSSGYRVSNYAVTGLDLTSAIDIGTANSGASITVKGIFANGGHVDDQS